MDLARAFTSEIDIVIVCEPSKPQEIDLCRSYLDIEAGKLASTSGSQPLKIKTAVVTGPVVQKILDYIHDQDIQLILMSSHGRSGVMLWPLGSTVDKVLRRTGVPLIMVKVKEAQGNAWQTALFKRILVALDSSDLAARAVPYVNAIAKKFGSEVALLHVIETEKPVHSFGRIDSIPFPEYEMESLQKRAMAYLERAAQNFSHAGAVIKVVRTGNVAEEIIRYARDYNCSLIALSSHGHSGLENWFLGSVTNKVLHASQKSLLFVPALES